MKRLAKTREARLQYLGVFLREVRYSEGEGRVAVQHRVMGIAGGSYSTFNRVWKAMESKQADGLVKGTPAHHLMPFGARPVNAVVTKDMAEYAAAASHEMAPNYGFDAIQARETWEEAREHRLHTKVDDRKLALAEAPDDMEELEAAEEVLGKAVEANKTRVHLEGLNKWQTQARVSVVYGDPPDRWKIQAEAFARLLDKASEWPATTAIAKNIIVEALDKAFPETAEA